MLEQCPYCGNNEEYYVKERYSGTCDYKHRFDGVEADNRGLYDHANHKSGKYAYCAACNKRIFKIVK